MKNNLPILGAKAHIYLKHEGQLEELSKIISKELLLPDFWFKSDQAPPHDVTAMCECLGFEIWLKKSNSVAGYQFSIKLETALSLNESMNNQMHDLSLWLARYIFTVCEIETYVLENQIVFKQ